MFGATTLAMIHAGTAGMDGTAAGTTDTVETIGGADHKLPGDMSGTLASASGSSAAILATTLATIGATTLAKIGVSTLAPKEPDASGTNASASG